MDLENKSQGWIKIHRKLLDEPFFSSSEHVHLWIYLLLQANHKPKMKHDVIVQRGQVLTGRNKLVEATGINRSKIERILSFFESEQLIEQLATARFRIITIKKYDKYQKVSSEVSSGVPEPTLSVTAGEHKQEGKNDKNEENEKKVYVAKDFNLQNCRTKASLLKYVNKMEMPAKNKENLQYIVMAAVKEQNYNPFEIQELIENYTYEEEKPVNSRRNVRRV